MSLLFASLMLALTAGATIFFQSFLSRSVSLGALRLLRMGLFFLAFCAGLAGSCVALIGNALDPSDLYPIATHALSDDYFFTQQEYGFVTLANQGYNLTFYQKRPFWLAEELGSIQLVCKGRETVSVAIKPSFDLCNRLLIKVDNVTVIDTVLSFKTEFYFRHTVHQ